jgi:glycosyltransferase involved in cell wall biosynthesis
MPDPNPIASAQGSELRSVSVVIPTRNRAALVPAAVRSAFSQSEPPLEVIVVIDGPELDAECGTVAALRQVDDARLRVVQLAETAGGAEARNHGVRLARGRWIAFLDDDDLWLPDKLSQQLAHAATLPLGETPILSCRVLARAPGWEEIWPKVVYTGDRSVAEYLFCRRGWGYGEALLQTSTLMAPRRLLEQVPFTPGLRKHQDWDWLLRACAAPGTALYCVGERPLVVFHVEGGRSSVSRVADWRASLDWARQRRALIPRRALRGFLAIECAAQAQRQSWKERAAMAGVLLSFGPPTFSEALQVAVFLLVPQGLRRRLRDLLRRPCTAASP